MRAGRGCDASSLGKEAWWGILAVAEATQSTAAPEGASRARHCGRCLSGAHGACRALEAHRLAAHAHEAASLAWQTGAQPLCARNSAWAARRLLGAARRCKAAYVGFDALIGTGEAGGAGVRALLARQRGRRALRAVRAGRARPANQLARRGLEGAGLALETRSHVGVGCDRAGAARRLPGATGWRVVALEGRRAFRISCEVGGVGVRAFLARQRRAGALGAERAGLAGDARLLALTLLVRARRALSARALAGVGLDGAGAAFGLLGAARRREVARVGSRAVGSGAKVGLVGVCALDTRQRRRRALRAVRARRAGVALGVAGLVHELARAALVTLGLIDQRLHVTRAAWHLLGAAGWRKVARLGLGALAGAGEAGGAGVCALRARQRRAGALGAVRAGLAGDAHLLALVGLVLACRAPDARGRGRVWRDRAGAALGLHCAARRRKVAHVGLGALVGAGKVGGDGERARRARQRGTGTLGAVRAGLAGDARLLARVGLVLSGGASVTEGSGRGGRNEAGRAVPAVGWVGAPRDRIGLPSSARLARRAAILAAVWVEHAGGARRERLPQARRSFCRTGATAWTVAAYGRLDVLAQLARRTRQAACASFVRVVCPGCARNAACLHQAGDPDREVRSGRAQQRSCARNRAVSAATVALAAAPVVRLLARVAEVSKCALIRAAGEVHWGQGQRRWRDPQAERAVDGSIFPQAEHTAGWARGLGRGERHIPQH
eukprot:scaffold23068_cov70-Phaeocystis_antarctica.AAC.4